MVVGGDGKLVAQLDELAMTTVDIADHDLARDTHAPLLADGTIPCTTPACAIVRIPPYRGANAATSSAMNTAGSSAAARPRVAATPAGASGARKPWTITLDWLTPDVVESAVELPRLTLAWRICGNAGS